MSATHYIAILILIEHLIFVAWLIARANRRRPMDGDTTDNHASSAQPTPKIVEGPKRYHLRASARKGAK